MDLASPAVSGTSVYANGLIKIFEDELIWAKHLKHQLSLNTCVGIYLSSHMYCKQCYFSVVGGEKCRFLLKNNNS